MNDPQPLVVNPERIALRLAQARQSRRMIKWAGYDILLSDLPTDDNDAEYPLCEAFCSHCHDRMWVFPTMQTSCQICGHDWEDGLWVLVDNPPQLDLATERNLVIERMQHQDWFDRAKAACQHRYDAIRAIHELTGSSITLQEKDRKTYEAAIDGLDVLALSPNSDKYGQAWTNRPIFW